MSGFRDSMRTLAVRGYYTTKWVMLQPGELCSTSLWVVVTWVPLENLELRVGALMRSWGAGLSCLFRRREVVQLNPVCQDPPFAEEIGELGENGGGWRRKTEDEEDVKAEFGY